MINPDIAGYKKWVQSVVGKYHAELKSVTTEWLAFSDTDGDIVAIVPKLTLEFKSGVDYVQDIMRESDSVYSTQITNGDKIEVKLVTEESDTVH